MTKTIITLIITFFFWNCSDKKKSEHTEFVIENKVKVDFLNKILSDTINLKLLPDQNILISDFNFLPKLPQSIPKNGEYEKVSEIEFLSHHLKENDTIFIKQQIESNKDFNLNDLSKYGYRILNTSELLKNDTSAYDLSSIILENPTETDRLFNGFYVIIDKPIFNKNLDRAYLSINGLHSGKEYIFIEEDGIWRKNEIGSWIE